jgi:hypothetical protein
MTPIAAAARGGPRLMETSGGEVEPERWSRLENGIEAIVVYAVLQAALWSGIASPTPLNPIAWPRALGFAAVGVVALYVILAARSVHGDSWNGLGLDGPRESARFWVRSGAAFRIGSAALVLAIPLLVAVVGWDSLLIRLGVRLTWPGAYSRLIDSPWRQAGSLIAALAFGALLAPVVVRWSNLGPAARHLALPAGLLLAGIGAAALISAAVTGDWTRFQAFAWTGRRDTAFLPRLAAYLPWGLLQQWLFLSYLNTRIRKAVPMAGWVGVPGRAIAAGLTGLAFGAIHWPNAPLAALTCIVACVSGWLFQRDCSRNLFLFSLAHGFAGTLLATLTPIRMAVGPQL